MPMQHRQSDVGAEPRRAAALMRACVLLTLVAAVRMVYLRWFCPYSLVEDEAQYWVWSRHLAGAYATKGPGIAWCIRGATTLFSSEDEWTVRSVAAFCAWMTGIAVAWLSWEGARTVRACVLGAACCQLVPVFQAAGLLATTDGPLLACWAWTALAVWKSVGADSRGKAMAWLALAGLALGAGTLCKHSMLLIVPGVGWWCWRGGRARPPAGWVWVIAALIFAACMTPMVLWNARHGWPNVAHLLGHIGVGTTHVAAESTVSWIARVARSLGNLASFVGVTLLAGGPVVLLGMMEAWNIVRHADIGRAGPWGKLMVVCAAPILLFYLAVSVVTPTEGNWAVAGFITLVPLAARRIDRALGRTSRERNLARGLWNAGVIVGVVCAVVTLRLDLLARVPVVGRWIPVGRFIGAREMGANVSTLVDALRNETGKEPFVVAHHYGRAAQLWYEYGRHAGVPVYCSSSVIDEGRSTPWDFWPEVSLRAPRRELLGRPAVAVGLQEDVWQHVFTRVVRAPDDGLLAGDRKLVHNGANNGRPSRPAFLVYDFRGIQPRTPRDDR